VSDDVLTMYVVIEHPYDYPESYVIRQWDILRGEVHVRDIVAVADTRQEVERVLLETRPGLVYMPPQRADDKVIVGVWM
jgi:hypothetical protein